MYVGSAYSWTNNDFHLLLKKKRMVNLDVLPDEWREGISSAFIAADYLVSLDWAQYVWNYHTDANEDTHMYLMVATPGFYRQMDFAGLVSMRYDGEPVITTKTPTP